MFFSKRKNEKLMILNDNGGIYEGIENKSSFAIPTERQIIKKYIKDNIKIINNEIQIILNKGSKKDKSKLDYYYQLKDYYSNININNINEGANLYNNDLLLVRYNENGIYVIQDTFVKLMGPDCYKLQTMELQLNDYLNKEIPNKKTIKNRILIK